MKHEIQIVCFKGIPQVAFHSRDDLVAYLEKEDTSFEKVLEDMENNPMPNWEVYCVEVK